uniref:O-antigen ligase-related domain-containing protein n=1 Tax=uncultured Acidobacteriota bacterium TaxID=171953 RepID=Q7X332_9BACT|nr:hypothetical protein [uncultured Acidobacteriota bacterium]
MTGLGVLIAFVGLFYRARITGLVYGWWQPIEGSSANGFGPFVNRNHFAGWMVMATCVAIGGLCGGVEQALHRSRGRRAWVAWLSSPEASRIVLTVGGIMVMATALVWSMSRSGMVSLACALGCFGWLVKRRASLAAAGRTLLLTTLGAVLIVSLSWRGTGRVLRWFADTRDLLSRRAAWQDGWRLAGDFPLTGTGLNTYGDAMLFYQQQVLENWMSHAHNDYLQLLAEGGLLVCAPAIASAVLLALALRRSVGDARRDGDPRDYWIRAGAAVGLGAMCVQETVEFSLQIPANALLFATLAAMALSRPQPSPSSKTFTQGERGERGDERNLIKEFLPDLPGLPVKEMPRITRTVQNGTVAGGPSPLV